MGCAKSKQDQSSEGVSSSVVGGSLVANDTAAVAQVQNEPPPLPEINLAGLDPVSRFEFSLPFYRIKIETLEKRLKKATGEKKTISLEELKTAFAKDNSWNDLNDEKSLLRQVIASDFFKTDENVFEMNRDAFVLMGILHSKGDMKTKTKTFYDVL